MSFLESPDSMRLMPKMLLIIIFLVPCILLIPLPRLVIKLSEAMFYLISGDILYQMILKRSTRLSPRSQHLSLLLMPTFAITLFDKVGLTDTSRENTSSALLLVYSACASSCGCVAIWRCSVTWCRQEVCWRGQNIILVRAWQEHSSGKLQKFSYCLFSKKLLSYLVSLKCWPRANLEHPECRVFWKTMKRMNISAFILMYVYPYKPSRSNSWYHIMCPRCSSSSPRTPPKMPGVTPGCSKRRRSSTDQNICKSTDLFSSLFRAH